MKNMKKIIFTLIILKIVSFNLFSLNIKDLWNFALENNLSIKNAKSNFKTNSINLETQNGYYVPSVNIYSSTLTDDYKFENGLENLNLNLMYRQLLPGGFSLEASTSYANSILTFNEISQIMQSPKISLSLSNSLYSYWLQGEENPTIKELKLLKDYNYYLLLNTKKNVLQSIVQNFILYMIAEKKVLICKNSLIQNQLQIENETELYKKGYSTQSDILSLEKTKNSLMQDKYELELNIFQIKSTLSVLCGKIILENQEFEFSQDDFDFSLWKKELENIQDPYMELMKINIEQNKNSIVLGKQNSAPTITMNVTSQWSLDSVDSKKWYTAFKLNEPASIQFDFSVNLSPLFKSAGTRQDEVLNINLKNAIENLDDYILQKKSLICEYKKILEIYKKQRIETEYLLEKEKNHYENFLEMYKNGTCSEFDCKNVSLLVKNYELTRDCFFLYEILYEWFLNFL